MEQMKATTAAVAVLEETDDALGTLSPHEELLLRLRFGIGGRRQSIPVIARHFGVRTQDLLDLEARALARLRQNALAKEHLRRHTSPRL
jgi:DNA-directed RNA polymerase sigma subunit (sigma70/sigma32)